jgi:hypothetical protein
MSKITKGQSAKAVSAKEKYPNSIILIIDGEYEYKLYKSWGFGECFGYATKEDAIADRIKYGESDPEIDPVDEVYGNGEYSETTFIYAKDLNNYCWRKG